MRVHEILTTLKNVYTDAYYSHPESYGAKIVEAVNSAKFNNGQPLNVLKACMIYECALDFSSALTLNDIKLHNLNVYLSNLSGYDIAARVQEVTEVV